MNFSLKKARKLETKIGAFISAQSADFDFTFEGRINDLPANVDKAAVDARTAFLEKLKLLDNLNEIRYSIRSLISTANAEGGDNSIDSLLNEKVQLESKISRLNLIRFQKYDKNLMEDELAANKKVMEAGTDRFGRTKSTFDVNFLTEVDEQHFKDEKFKTSKRIEEIEDKLAELNYSKQISLGANSVKLLQDNNLL